VSNVADPATGSGPRCVCVSEQLRDELLHAAEHRDPLALDEAKRRLIALTPCCEPFAQSTVARAE
jgi:hypothetical protein